MPASLMNVILHVAVCFVLSDQESPKQALMAASGRSLSAIAPEAYVGLAEYRHLERDLDE